MSKNQQTEFFRALVIDDEADIRELLEITLQRMGANNMAVPDVKTAIKALNEHQFDICLTDMRLPDGSGFDVIRHIQTQCPELPVAVITAYGNVEDAVESLKAGAFDFISKPVDLETLKALIEKAVSLPKSDSTSTDLPELIGKSPSVEGLRKMIGKLARSQAPVYISGESGTGKELVARLIHKQGPRVDKPFVPVNCGAIPAELMESELFGHVKGSFTGAVKDKPGLFQAAEGGTLFLDEVAELPLHMQVKLLRAIQERHVRPVGAQAEEAIDVRILSATHKPLGRLVETGDFRQDLYYRLNVIQLEVPALRERYEDISVLSSDILKRIADKSDSEPLTLSPDAIKALKHYDFPGNIRELENILERAVTLADNDVIEVDDLMLPQTEISSHADGTSAYDNDGQSFSLEEDIADRERRLIQEALEKARYNKTRAAKLLGLTFRQFRYRLKKLDIDV